MAFPVSPSRQAHKLTIVSLVMTKKPGAVITKDEITSATKATPTVWQSGLQAAKKTLRDEHGVVLDTIRDVGYRVALASDKAGIADGKIKSAHRKAKEASGILATVSESDFKELSKDEQNRHVLTKTRVEIAKDVTAPRRMKELSTRVANSHSLPSGLDSMK